MSDQLLAQTTLSVMALLNREQMLRGFRENGGLTPEIESLSNIDLAEAVAKTILEMEAQGIPVR